MNAERKPATIKDIARITGYSIATVSRALNGSGGHDTVRIVLETARKLGYKKNMIAQSLKLNTTRTVGVIVPELSNIFFTQILEVIEEELYKYGYTMFLCSSRGSSEGEKEKAELLLERNISGLIIVPASRNLDHLDFLLESRIPVVFFDRQPKDDTFDYVGIDNRLAAYKATRMMIQKGHRRIGFLGGDISIGTSNERYKGYLSAMYEAGLKVEDEFIILNGVSATTGYKAMEQVMEMRNRPSAFFIVNDLVHRGVLSYLYSNSYQAYAESIHFCAFDFYHYNQNLQLCDISVEQPLQQIGKHVFLLLKKRLEGDMGDFPERIILSASIISTESHGM